MASLLHVCFGRAAEATKEQLLAGPPLIGQTNQQQQHEQESIRLQQWQESIQQDRKQLDQDKAEFQTYREELITQQKEQQEQKLECTYRVERVTQQEVTLQALQVNLEQGRIELENQKAAIAEQTSSLNTLAKALQERAISLEDRESALEDREGSLEDRQSTIKDQEIVLQDRDCRLRDREALLIERELGLENIESSLKEREAELNERQASLDRREKEIIVKSSETIEEVPIPTATTSVVPSAMKSVASGELFPQPFDEGHEVTFVPTSTTASPTTTDPEEQEIQDALQISLDEECQSDEGEDQRELSISIDDGDAMLPTPTPTDAKPTERERLDQRIELELKALIEAAEAEELDEPMEEEAVAALFKGAHAVAYKKKYYDAISDEFMYFPSILRAIVDYTLIEEAEKHYYEEEDEFPIIYAAVLRAEASNQLTEHDDGRPDEDYMARLASDVE